MRAVSSHPAVLILWIQCVTGWFHPKCYIYDKSEDMPNWNCPNAVKQTAYCPLVTVISEDLLGLPHNINTLCITMRDDTTSMSLGFFSLFRDLEYLHIYGCFSEIFPPMVSQDPSNLQTLYLYSPGCCDCYIGPHTFRHLVKLRVLTIVGYRLSAMAPDVFHGIPNLLRVLFTFNYIKGSTQPCMEDLSDVLCRIMYITSLKELRVEAPEVTSLNQSNCSILNASERMTPDLNNLTNVQLSLGKITVIDEGSLACFQNLEFFGAALSQEALMQLRLSGIRQIEKLSIVSKIDFRSICKVVFFLTVKELDICTSDFISLSISSVKLCIGLKYMDIYSNNYSPYKDFEWDFISTLKNLDILRMTVPPQKRNYICSFQKQPITWLTKLDLNGRYLEILSEKQFSCLENLRSLYLRHLLISNIEDYAFLGLIKLEFLDMKQNRIKQININSFFGLHSLKFLDLRENPLSPNIEAFAFTHLKCLSQMFLGDLNYPPTEPVIRMNLTLILGNILSQLTELYISSGMRPMHLIIGSDITSKQNLSLQLKGKTVSFEDCNRPFFKSVKYLNTEAEEFLCGSEFMGKYFRSVEIFKYTSKLSAKTVDLTSINQLIHLRKLILSQVDFLNQQRADLIFHNLTKVEVLKLEYCRIYSLEGSLTKDLKSLKLLILRINNVFNVLFSFTEPLSSLKYLIFNKLQMFCSCDNNWLINWSKQYRQVEVIMSVVSLDDLKCLSGDGLDTPNFVKYTEANCSTQLDFILFATTALGVLLFMLVVLVHNQVGTYLLPLYHITLGWLSEAMRSNATGRYDYDAFVSYSGKDERWVVEELLPNLEQRGPPFLNLCLHSRDFQLGKDIVENITDSLYRSRHTLCLVSRHYLRSNWCSLEMKLATSRLQVEQRDILLLVFLEDIPPRWLSAHHRLARLVKTRTYLDWPQDPQQQQAFWDRLWAKLKCPTEE